MANRNQSAAVADGKAAAASVLAAMDAKHKGDKPLTAMGAAMEEAVVEQALAEQAAIIEHRDNPIVKLFGTPEFVLDASQKYDDEKVKGKSSQRIAKAQFNLGGTGVPFMCNVYRYEQSGSDKDGAYVDEWFVVSLPKGAIAIGKENPTLSVLLTNHLDKARETFETWYQALGSSIPANGGGKVRHVKRNRQ